jgi:hypothetical protein
MSDPAEQPDEPRNACRAPGRRRATTARTRARSNRSRSRDACPERPRLLNPEHEAFVDWFVIYWRQSGAQLFANNPTSKEA